MQINKLPLPPFNVVTSLSFLFQVAYEKLQNISPEAAAAVHMKTQKRKK